MVVKRYQVANLQATHTVRQSFANHLTAFDPILLTIYENTD